MAKSLYLHVPFCKSICHYCDFTRTLYNERNASLWLKRIKEEFNHKEIETLDTIYIGGGTPTSLSYVQLEELLNLLDLYKAGVKEYTIESNIESLTVDKIKLLKEHGVNRISLGIQSLHDELLIDMNRKHRKKDVYQKIEEIYQNGITNISIDLIYGFDKQTLDMWEKDLKEVVSWDYISHISLYSLTIEDHSVYGKTGRKTVENEVEASMYDMAITILENHDFKQYEVANFAKSGYASLHNQTYWEYNDFYGIGIGASGKEKGVRYDNSGTLTQYLKHQNKIDEEVLSITDQMFENIMMSLRMRKGLDLKKFKNRYNKDIMEIYATEIQEEIKMGRLFLEDEHLKTSRDGMFYLHDILVKFLR